MFGSEAHDRPLVRPYEVAGNGATVFGNDVGNTVSLINFVSEDARVVHGVCMNNIGAAVFTHIPRKCLHPRAHPADAVQINNRKTGEKIHTVVSVGIQPALIVFPDAVRTGKNRFGMDAQIAEHRRNHPDFQTFSLQGLCLKTEKDSVHIGFSFGIPRRNNGNVHEKTFVIINLRSSEKTFAVFRRPF